MSSVKLNISMPESYYLALMQLDASPSKAIQKLIRNNLRISEPETITVNGIVYRRESK